MYIRICTHIPNTHKILWNSCYHFIKTLVMYAFQRTKCFILTFVKMNPSVKSKRGCWLPLILKVTILASKGRYCVIIQFLKYSLNIKLKISLYKFNVIYDLKNDMVMKPLKKVRKHKYILTLLAPCSNT